MDGQVVARFEIERFGFLDCEGKAQAALPEFTADTGEIVAMYRAMVFTRTFDAKAVALQRTGRLGTFPSSLGQEAVAVGTAAAMRAEDVLLPSFRDQGGQFVRGVTAVEVLLYWGGHERGSDFAAAAVREDFPVCIPVGTHAPHAAGVALAFQLRREPRVAVCLAGDGATSKGDFYEALNLAGVWSLPVVFVVNNNGWAISVPRARQTAARTLAQKAVAAGIEGVQADGNDVIAVRHAVACALERARSGGGPTLVECETYRLCDHTTSDSARRYREDAEVSACWQREPIARLRNYLAARGVWSKTDEETLVAECARRVEDAVRAYLAIEPEPATAMFDDLFETLPAELRPQREAVAACAAGDEEDNARRNPR